MKRILFFSAAIPLLLLSFASCSRSGRVTGPSVVVEPAFPRLSFDRPVAMLQAPGDPSRWFMAEKGGRILAFANSDSAESVSLVLDLSARVESGPTEAGLLGMAFHPRWAQSGQAFLSYTGPGGGVAALVSHLSRFSSADSGRTLSPGSEQGILSVEQPFANHNGGGIAFGPDGFLYLGLGDGGSAGDPMNNAQDTFSLLGKFLRLDVTGGRPYAIPAGNPFAAAASLGRPEIFAWGFRNPWRFSFDAATGELWAGDVGQDSWEEVDLVEAGRNYGWRIKEGRHCYGQTPCDGFGFADPVAEYGHGEGCSITGGFVYRGNMIPSLAGAYLYGDYCSGRVWGLFHNSDGTFASRLLARTGLKIASFAQDDRGELYLLDYEGGNIYRLTAPKGASR